MNPVALHLRVAEALEYQATHETGELECKAVLTIIQNELDVDACFLLTTNEEHPDRLYVHSSTADKLTPFRAVEFDVDSDFIRDIAMSEVLLCRPLSRLAYKGDRLWELIWQVMHLGPYPEPVQISAAIIRRAKDDIEGILVLVGTEHLSRTGERFEGTLKLLAHQFFVASEWHRSNRLAEQWQRSAESQFFDSLLRGGQAVILHSVFAPLQNLELLVENAKHDTARGDTKLLLGRLNSMRAMGAEVNRVVKNFLLLSKSTTKDNTLSQQQRPVSHDKWVDVRAAVDQVERGLSSLAQMSGKSFVVRLEKPFTFPMEKSDFDEILSNLIHNAIKYGGVGTKIKIRLHHANQHSYLDVISYGIPIRKEDRTRIFQLGYRTPEAIALHFNAVGIGLFHCQQIAKRSRAELFVLPPAIDEEEDSGTPNKSEMLASLSKINHNSRTTFRLRAKR